MVLWESQEMDGSRKTEISGWFWIHFVLNKNVFDVLRNKLLTISAIEDNLGDNVGNERQDSDESLRWSNQNRLALDEVDLED